MFDVLQSTRYRDTTLLKCVCPNFATSTKIVDLHGDAKSNLIKRLRKPPCQESEVAVEAYQVSSQSTQGFFS